MAVSLFLYEQKEEKYIDMEVSSFSTFLYNSISPHHSTEFHHLINLLPLHPRTPTLEMVLKLLHSPDHALQKVPRPTTTTPSGSSTRQVHMTKRSSLGSKLKACSAYLKSLFSNSGCSDESDAVECAKRNTLGQIQSTLYRSNTVKNKEKMVKGGGRHKRSLSIPLRTHQRNKSKSKSLPCSDDQFQHIRRSTKPETESPIQGAIAHCKRSQQRCSSSREIKIKKDQSSEGAEISR